MTEPIKLDETDRAILDLLYEDGRMSVREVGRQIGVAEATIRQRLKKLQEQDAMRFNLIVDPLRLGRTASAYIRIRMAAREAPALAGTLAQFDEVAFSALTVGAWNLLVFVVAESRDVVSAFVDAHLRCAPGVLDIDVQEPTAIVRHRFDLARFI